MIEIWIDIKDYEGLYQVSNFGRVKNVKRNSILKASDTGNGYLMVILCKNGKKKMNLVHRLVAQAFIPNPLNLPCVNHKIEGYEGKQINTVENLEWCTVAYNNSYGTHIERCAKAKSKPVLQYSLDGKLIMEWSSIREARKLFGSHIQQCCIGKLKQTHGYIWKYKEKEED